MANDFVPDTQLNKDSCDDILLGAAGMDQIDGGSGNYTHSGGQGDDLLAGREGGDVQDGDDKLNGARGRDVLNGGKGNNVLIGNDDADTLDGNDVKRSLIQSRHIVLACRAFNHSPAWDRVLASTSMRCYPITDLPQLHRLPATVERDETGMFAATDCFHHRL